MPSRRKFNGSLGSHHLVSTLPADGEMLVARLRRPTFSRSTLGGHFRRTPCFIGADLVSLSRGLGGFVRGGRSGNAAAADREPEYIMALSTLARSSGKGPGFVGNSMRRPCADQRPQSLPSLRFRFRTKVLRFASSSHPSEPDGTSSVAPSECR